MQSPASARSASAEPRTAAALRQARTMRRTRTELPGKRIEEPDAIRIGREIPIEIPRQHIKQRRAGQRQGRLADQQPKHRREKQQQHDIERQHVHIDRLEFQDQRLEYRDVRLLEEIKDIHFLGIERIVEGRRDIGDFGHEDREQKDVRDVDLPGAPQHARARDDDAALAHGAAIDESRRIAGNEDEDLGCVAKAVIANGEPVGDVLRNVIEKNQPQRDPAEQIEPQIALAVATAGSTAIPTGSTSLGLTKCFAIGFTTGCRSFWTLPPPERSISAHSLGGFTDLVRHGPLEKARPDSYAISKFKLLVPPR